jgi:presequence protease
MARRASCKTLDLSQEELTKSIIGAIGDLDAYQLPDAKGYTSMQRYLIGETDEDRQQLREEVLSASQADFRQFGEVLERLNASPSVVVLGSADAIAKANEARSGWLDVNKVL